MGELKSLALNCCVFYIMSLQLYISNSYQ